MRFLTAILIVGTGGSIAIWLPAPHYWIALLVTLGIALSVVLCGQRRKVILRYGRLTWTRWELCRHFLITGDTGSGKTISGFQPMLRQLTKNVPDWGGLVLGVKGDEHRFIEKLAAEFGRERDVIHLQVRPPDASTKWQPAHRYNLLSDRSLPWSTHARIITDIASSMTKGTQHPFFGTIAQISLTRAFEILDALGDPVTIPRAYELLTSQATSERAVKRLLRNQSNTKTLKFADFLQSTFTKIRAHEQKEGIEGTVKTFLEFYLQEDVAAVFCSEQPNSFTFSQLDQGAILTVTMPQSLATERRYIQTYLKIFFYLHALRRYDVSEEERNQRNLLLLVADEFQDLVTASDNGISDHQVVDRIRGAGACVIAGMQSELSADVATNEKQRKVLALNLRSRMVFRAASAEDARLSAEFIGRKDLWKRTYSSSSGGPHTVTRRREPDLRIRPGKLMQLRDHEALLIHPSKRFRFTKNRYPEH